jgi:two-component system, OmpR family, phosphate regulon sensor histidine kinase PhoR
MRKSIFFKMFMGYLVIMIAMAVLILTFTYEIVKSHYEQTTAYNLKNIAIPLRQVIIPLLRPGEPGPLNASVREYARELELRITVIDPTGRVLADSEKDPATLENHRDRPEVGQALAGRSGQSIRFSTTLWQDLLYVALPIEKGGKIVGVLRLSTPLTHITNLLKALRIRELQLTLLVIVISLLIAALISHLLSTPIRELSKAARRIASGDLSVRVSPKPHADDEIRDLTEGFNEMTQRLEQTFAELRGRNEELESIISSMTEALLVLDEEGKVRLFNAGAQKLMPAEKIMDRYYWELLRSTRLNALIEEGSERSISGEVELADKSFLCIITPLASGKAKVVLLHDITESKQIERVKKDLVVNVSHELRTPLTAIKGFTETLLDEADPRSMEYLQIIKRHTDRLIAMVNDLLTLSELEEKPQLIIEDVNLQELVANVLAIYDPRIRAKGLELTAAISPATIKADPFKLEQLLTNLIDNALKYTENGRISVDARIKEGNAVITVKDTGIGIPNEDLGRVFERFYVVDKSRSRSMGGTGLGLSIAKHIATLHKGSIEVASTPYAGSTFTVTIPVR